MLRKQTKLFFAIFSMALLLLYFQNCAKPLDRSLYEATEASEETVVESEENLILTPIVTLYSTGLDDNRLPLAPDSRDLHYFMKDSGQLTYATELATWVKNSSESVWISPAVDRQMAPGDYTVVTTFDLSDWRPETASVSLRLSVDDHLVDILLNDVSVAQGLIMPDEENFKKFTNSILIQYGFIEGVNRLEFVFNNIVGNSAKNPTGIRVELSGTAALK